MIHKYVRHQQSTTTYLPASDLEQIQQNVVGLTTFVSLQNKKTIQISSKVND